MLSSGVQRAIFYAIESNEPHDCGKLVTFVLRHHVVKVTYSVFQPAMSMKRTILSSSLDQRIGIYLRSLDEARRVEQGACWRAGAGKRKSSTNGSYRTQTGEWNSGDRVDINYVKRQTMTYVE